MNVEALERVIHKGYLIHGDMLLPKNNRKVWAQAYTKHVENSNPEWIGPYLTKRGWTPLLLAAFIEFRQSTAFWGNIPYPVRNRTLLKYVQTMALGEYLTQHFPWPSLWEVLCDHSLNASLLTSDEVRVFQLGSPNPPFLELKNKLLKVIPIEGEYDIGNLDSGVLNDPSL